MSICIHCEEAIFEEEDNEVVFEGKSAHEKCHNLVNDHGVPCRFCRKEIDGKAGIVKHVEGEGLVKFHVACYRCIECGNWVDLDLFIFKDGCLPFCQNCKRCFNCKSTDYKTCEVTPKEDHPTKTFIVMCGICLGKEDAESTDSLGQTDKE